MKNKSLNKGLYSWRVFKIWSEKSKLLETEYYFLTEYLLNKNSKVIEAGTGDGRIIFEIEKMVWKFLNNSIYHKKNHLYKNNENQQ